MIRQIGSQYQAESRLALEERVHQLETRVATLADAVDVLARGLEGGPLAEPDERKVIDAARKAHDLLLAARAVPPAASEELSPRQAGAWPAGGAAGSSSRPAASPPLASSRASHATLSRSTAARMAGSMTGPSPPPLASGLGHS
jgi:hypothetical protein